MTSKGHLRVACPHCGSEEVRQSHRSWRFYCTTFRCRKCHRRFRVANRPRLALTGIAVGVVVVIGARHLQNLPVRTGAVPVTNIPAGPGPTSADTNMLEYQVAARLWQEGDYPAAFEWFQKAAKQGSLAAHYELGKAYLYGRGIPQHFKLAAEHLLQAAQAGHVEAQYQLAQLYRNGQGVTQDLVHAYMWLNVAASSGHPWAANERDQLKVAMSAEEILQAQQMSLKWLNEDAAR